MGGPAPGGDKTASDTPPADETPSGPAGPTGGGTSADVQKTSGDLDALAPLGSAPPLYGPGAVVFNGSVSFTVTLRGPVAPDAAAGEAGP